jgi:acyl-CoA synthetase (AMP-forming)/AMP-acid ligase II
MYRDVLKKSTDTFKEPLPLDRFQEKKWSEYFDDSEDLKVDGDIFRIYKSKGDTTGDIKTVLILLHGAGLTSLSWALFVVLVGYTYW